MRIFRIVAHDFAERLVLHCAELVAARKGGIGPAGWTNYLILHVATDLRVVHLGIIALFGLQRPGLDGSIDLAQVVDAGIHLRRAAGLHEVGNRNRRQQTDDGYNDHDLHQGEPARLG